MSTRVLVTGAGGYIGRAVAAHLARRGHQVRGAYRNPEHVATLRRDGIEPVILDIRDEDALTERAADAEVVVHCAFAASTPRDLPVAIALERRVTRTLLSTPATVVYTSGVGVLADGEGCDPVHEDRVPSSTAPLAWRFELEQAVRAARGRVIRPALVHGRGGNRILIDLIEQSAARGASGYPGEGTSRLPTVHLDDLVEAYALIVERGQEAATYAAVGADTTTRQVAHAIADLLGVPARSAADRTIADELPALQWIAGDLVVDAPRLRDQLGWHPTGLSLPEDLRGGSYTPPAPSMPAPVR